MPAKLTNLLQSRKFWALVVALVAVAAGFFQNQIDEWQAIQAAVAALSAYSLATGISTSGK